MQFDDAVEEFLADLKVSSPGSARAWSSPLRRAAMPTRPTYGAEHAKRYTDPDDIRAAMERSRRKFVGLGGRDLDSITNPDLKVIVSAIQKEARSRVNGVQGMGAQENAITALRVFFKWARAKGHTTATPDEGLDFTKRGKIERRAYSIAELGRIQGVLDRSADPELARLFLRLALETGARHSEMLVLTYADLDAADGTVRLTPKGFTGQYLYQPITASLFSSLEAFVARRSTGPVRDSTRLLLDRRGRPISRRYFEGLCGKVRRDIPELGRGSKSWFTTHSLRHTSATIMERTGGEAVTRLFLGHKDSSKTQIYTSATIEELRAAMIAIWGEPLAGHGHGFGVGEVHAERLQAIVEMNRAKQDSVDHFISRHEAPDEPDPMEVHLAQVRDREEWEAQESLLKQLGVE